MLSRWPLRAAAVDTGAIEGLYKVDRGFTVTVAEEQPGWERKPTRKARHSDNSLLHNSGGL